MLAKKRERKLRTGQLCCKEIISTRQKGWDRGLLYEHAESMHAPNQCAGKAGMDVGDFACMEKGDLTNS